MLWKEFQPIFKTLSKAFGDKGFGLYLVGGCVRDRLLGFEPKDYDLTTSARPEKIVEVLTSIGMDYYPIGEKFGTIAAKLADGMQVEITTHRRDLTPGRHPDVIFTDSLEEDLARRDFRMNSIACTIDENIVDPFGGQDDLKHGMISTTGDPFERFQEDPLRMLRAVRFVSKLGFLLHEQTREAIYKYAHAILIVSRERWLDELTKLLVGEHVARALEYMKHSRLLGYVLPEVFPITLVPPGNPLQSKNLWLHTLSVVDKVRKDPLVRWAALTHDIGKPQTRYEEGADTVHFFQHWALGAELVHSLGKRLKMSNEFLWALKGLVSLHHQIADAVSRNNDPPVSLSALRKVIRNCEEFGCSVEDLVELFSCDQTSNRPESVEKKRIHVELLRKALQELKEEELRPRLPKGIGEEIMARFGLQPGPEVGRIRKDLDQMLLDGLILPGETMDDIFGKLAAREVTDA
jgi:poly(A) polymerase